MSPTSPLLATAGAKQTGEPNPRLPMQTLGQADFLKLLITQLTSQDPLNPKKDTEFIAQMAQFSALEQTRSMQQEIAQLRFDQQLVQANGLLGRMVQVQSGPDAVLSGIVGSVEVENGVPKIVVDGASHELNALVAISPETAIA